MRKPLRPLNPANLHTDDLDDVDMASLSLAMVDYFIATARRVAHHPKYKEWAATTIANLTAERAGLVALASK